MHMKRVDRMQKNDRLMVGPMARDTAQTKRAVDRVLHLVQAAADEIERSRRLPDAVVAALRNTGINRLMIPAALGGMEAPITDVMDVMERIAAVDGSAGWCAAIGAGSNVFAGYMPATGAATVFADPDQGSATMFAPVGRVVSEHGRAILSGHAGRIFGVARRSRLPAHRDGLVRRTRRKRRRDRPQTIRHKRGPTNRSQGDKSCCGFQFVLPS